MPIPPVFEQVCQSKGWSFEGDHVVVGLPGDRKQTVFLEEFEYEGQAHVRAYTKIGPIKNIVSERLTGALRVNFGLPYGGLAVEKDQLVMRDTFMHVHADPEEVEASLRYLAATADRFERTIFGPDQN